MSGNDLDSYARFVGRPEIEEIKALGRRLRHKRVHHVNSTKSGGGVAEILYRLVPLMRDVGIDATWDAIQGNPAFFDVTKMIHNAMHGQEIEFKPEYLDILERTCRENEAVLNSPADVRIIHDPQPLLLVNYRDVKPCPRWLWRCHIDLSEADPAFWSALRPYVERFDGAVFHLAEYTKKLSIPQYIVPPAIDPLADKNRELPASEVRDIISRLGIDPARPYVLQVSRFDRLKDPVGVIRAFKMIQRLYNAQLVLAGGSATDDPEGMKVLEEVRNIADGEPNIHILDLPPDSNLEINALQRGARVIVQKSIKEGFGLVVAEAMWKGKPVIGGAVGGIRTQITHNLTGFLVSTVEGTSFRMRQLLANPGLGDRLGAAARETVRSNFLLPGYLKKWILMLIAQFHPGEKIIFLR